MCLKLFYFAKIWKCAKKYYEIRKLLFLYYTKRRCSHIKPQLKVEIEDGRDIIIIIIAGRHKYLKPGYTDLKPGCSYLKPWYTNLKPGYKYLKPESEFTEFEPCLKSAKNRFRLSTGLNLETLNTIFEPIIFEQRLKFFKFASGNTYLEPWYKYFKP